MQDHVNTILHSFIKLYMAVLCYLNGVHTDVSTQERVLFKAYFSIIKLSGAVLLVERRVSGYCTHCDESTSSHFSAKKMTTWCQKLVLVCLFPHSPDGTKIRSKPQLARTLGKNVDLSSFDFQSGKILQSALRKSKRRAHGYDYARGLCSFVCLFILHYRCNPTVTDQSMYHVKCKS